MEFQRFSNFVQESVEVILGDLENLQRTADEANNNSCSSTLTFQTTRRPDDLGSRDDRHISRCTIPIVMVCISVIDMIGQWIKERPNDEFGSSAQIFFKKLSGKDDLNKQVAQDKFKEYFRHGIMHSFFAKKGFGVAYPAFIGSSLFTDFDNVGSTLDARYLLNIVRGGLKKLEEEVQNEQSEIAKKAFVGYKVWLKSIDEFE